MQTLAERLSWARKKAKLSQQELADAVGAGQSLIGNLESGSRKSSSKLPAIAVKLGVNALWLAEGRGSADGAEAGGDQEPTQSAATARILDILRGRSEEEIVSIASALDVLLKVGRPSKADAPEEFRLSGGSAQSEHRRKA